MKSTFHQSIFVLFAFVACVSSSFTFGSIGDSSSGVRPTQYSQLHQSSSSNKRQPSGEIPGIKTGWVHNQPKQRKPTTQEQQQEQQQEEEEGSGKERRTGWLHNQTSPKKKKEVESSKKESNAQKLLRLAKEKQMINHRIISSPTFHACGENRQVVITEHRIDVPLTHDKKTTPNDDTVNLYFTIVEQVSSEEDYTFFESLRFSDGKDVRKQRNKADLYLQHTKMKDANEMMIYLQGGPGFGSPTPISGIGLSKSSSWIDSAFNNGFKRIVLMDQRGTGK